MLGRYDRLAERGMVLLGTADRLAVRAQRSRDEDDRGAFAYSRTIVHQALENGVGILSEDVRADDRFATSAKGRSSTTS